MTMQDPILKTLDELDRLAAEAKVDMDKVDMDKMRLCEEHDGSVTVTVPMTVWNLMAAYEGSMPSVLKALRSALSAIDEIREMEPPSTDRTNFEWMRQRDAILSRHGLGR